MTTLLKTLEQRAERWLTTMDGQLHAPIMSILTGEIARQDADRTASKGSYEQGETNMDPLTINRLGQIRQEEIAAWAEARAANEPYRPIWRLRGLIDGLRQRTSSVAQQIEASAAAKPAADAKRTTMQRTVAAQTITGEYAKAGKGE